MIARSDKVTCPVVNLEKYMLLANIDASKASSDYYRGQPKAGTGHKIQFVPFVFSKSRFQGLVFRCD